MACRLVACQGSPLPSPSDVNHGIRAEDTIGIETGHQGVGAYEVMKLNKCAQQDGRQETFERTWGCLSKLLQRAARRSCFSRGVIALSRDAGIATDALAISGQNLQPSKPCPTSTSPPS